MRRAPQKGLRAHLSAGALGESHHGVEAFCLKIVRRDFRRYGHDSVSIETWIEAGAFASKPSTRPGYT
jgi:hypothetical protein